MRLFTFLPFAVLLSLQVSSVFSLPAAEAEPAKRPPSRTGSGTVRPSPAAGGRTGSGLGTGGTPPAAGPGAGGGAGLGSGGAIGGSSGLAAAGTGTAANPFILSIDCAAFQEVCEAQCIAILCFGAPQVLQYGGPRSSTVQRALSGAKSDPFRTPSAQLVGGGSMATPNSAWLSPEDTTAACSTQSGIGTLIAPVDAVHNSAEGSRVAGQLSINRARKGHYFKKAYSSTGRYCSALMRKQPAATVCKANAPPSDQINFMYRRTSKKAGNSILWQHVRYPSDKWAKKFPGY